MTGKKIIALGRSAATSKTTPIAGCPSCGRAQHGKRQIHTRHGHPALAPLLSSLTLLVALAAPLHAQRPPAGESTEPTILPDPRRDLEQSRARLAGKLDDAKVTPEQRAILIEGWLTEKAALEAQAAKQGRGNNESGNHSATFIETAIPHAPIPHDATPLQRDIVEMENEILDFRNSLSSIRLNPEQRAIQIEAFLNINREALKQLEEMKWESQRITHPQKQITSKAHQHDANSYKPAEVRELESFLTQADTLSPEARAAFLEIHSDRIDNLIKEIKNPEKEAK
jgi:hypothetical protein